MALDDFLQNLGAGILSQPNLANGLAAGFQNVNDQNTFNKLLSNPQALGLSPQQAQTMGQVPGYMGLPMLMKLQEANLPTPENKLVNAQVLGANADLSAKRADMDFLLQRQGMQPTTDDEWGKYLGGQGFSRQQAQPQQAGTAPSAAQSAPTLSAPQPQDAINEQVAANFIQSKIPGATITSQQRTPLHNAQVGGVPDSMHLSGQAVDFVLPKGTTFADAQQAIQQAGLPATELLNEGSHVHWGWGAKPGAAQPAQQPQAQAQSGALPLGDPNLAMQFAMKPTMLLSPQQVSAKGYRPGTVVAEDIFGNDTVKQEPDVKSPEAQQQTIDTAKAEALARNDAAIQAINDVAPGFLDQQAKAIATYRMQPQQVTNRNPAVGAAVMAKVYQYNPNYDARNYGASNKAVTQFDSGKQGDTVRSMNVAVQHLGTLQQVAGALSNGNAKLLNAVSNTFQDQFGSPIPNNFAAVRNLVADEVTKAVLGGAGALGDREEIRNTISSAASPQQLAGVIQNYKYLLTGQLNGLRQQFVSSTKLPATEFDTKLLPETQQALMTYHGPGQASAAAPSGPPARRGVYNPKTGNVEWQQ